MYKRTKRSILLFIMLLALLLPISLPFHLTVVNAAETGNAKISKRNLAIVMGKSAKLQINGTNAPVTWSTGNPTIATIQIDTGIITTQALGKTKIYGRVLINGIQKVYTCNVTVNPFPVKGASFGNLTAKIPKHYTIDEQQVQVPKSTFSNKVEMTNVTQYQLHPSKTSKLDSGQVTILTILPIETGLPASDYDELKLYATDWFQETKKNLNKSFGKDGKVKKYKISDVNSTHGEVVKIFFDYHYIEFDNTPASFSTTIYLLSINNFTLQITYIDNGTKKQTIPSIDSVAKHLLNTIKYN